MTGAGALHRPLFLRLATGARRVILPPPALCPARRLTVPFELKILAWGCVLALVHIFAASSARTRQYGRSWNMGARDEQMPEPSPVVGRLLRAQANFFETFPISAALLLLNGLLPLSNGVTVAGAALWLGARIIYLPLYATGVPVIRTFVWALSFLGILLLLWGPLQASLLG
jgi:uncharacterized MAPEG superfamily protein